MRAFHVAVPALYLCLKIIMILSHQKFFNVVNVSASRIARDDQTDRLALLAIKAHIMEDPFRGSQALGMNLSISASGKVFYAVTSTKESLN